MIRNQFEIENRNKPVAKKLMTIMTFSQSPARTVRPANKNASIPAQNVPNARLNPLMNVAPAELRQ